MHFAANRRDCCCSWRRALALFGFPARENARVFVCSDSAAVRKVSVVLRDGGAAVLRWAWVECFENFLLVGDGWEFEINK